MLNDVCFFWANGSPVFPAKNVGINFDGSKGEWADKEFVEGIMEEAENAKVLNHSFFVLSNDDIRNQLTMVSRSNSDIPWKCFEECRC